jgi:hypothetical protein
LEATSTFEGRPMKGGPGESANAKRLKHNSNNPMLKQIDKFQEPKKADDGCQET